jgi:hypothetical protein
VIAIAMRENSRETWHITVQGTLVLARTRGLGVDGAVVDGAVVWSSWARGCVPDYVLARMAALVGLGEPTGIQV